MRPVLDAAQIHVLIKGLPEKHILKNSPEDYVNDFVTAALEVYKPAKLKGVLQDKFLIPDACSRAPRRESQARDDRLGRVAQRFRQKRYRTERKRR